MTIEQIYREESGRILATLIRLLGDFDLAEEALQEAFSAALVQWPREGTPSNPRAWLVSTGRHKAVDSQFSTAPVAPAISGTNGGSGDPNFGEHSRDFGGGLWARIFVFRGERWPAPWRPVRMTRRPVRNPRLH